MMGSNTSALNQVTSQMDMYFCSAVEDPTQLTAQACLVRTCQGQLLHISCFDPRHGILAGCASFWGCPRCDLAWCAHAKDEAPAE